MKVVQLFDVLNDDSRGFDSTVGHSSVTSMVALLTESLLSSAYLLQVRTATLYTKSLPSIPVVALVPNNTQNMAGDSTREPSLPANDDDGASTNSEATEDSEHDNLEHQKKAAAKDLYQKSIAQETRHLLRHQIW